MGSNSEKNNGISVIMPVHNAGDYLETAVTSILKQSLENLELIIIDDYSTDNAINNLDKSDPRLKVIANNDKGIVSALNLGLQNANKHYVARMDADDIALPNRLEVQLNYLLTHPDIQVCGAQVELFRDDKKIQGGYQHYQSWINTLTDPDDIVKNIFIESPIPHPTAMMHKHHWLELGGYQDSGWPEDYDLWLRAHMEGFRFGKPTGMLLRWRDHDSRLSRMSDRYSKKSFFKAKAFYLAKLYPDKKFRIWGSGPTGALLHDELEKNNGNVIDFIDIAPKKTGNEKRNKPIVDAFEIKKTGDLILIAVSARGAREDIKEFLNQRKFTEGTDYICAA